MDAIVVSGVVKRFRKSTIRKEYTTFKTELVRWVLGRRQKEQAGTIEALRGVDLVVPQGKTVALIGRNGSGKSTLLKLITGIYKPTAGQIIFNGQSIAGLTPDAVLRRGIARTFQNIRLFNNMSVLENVLVGQHVKFPHDLASITFHLPNYRRAERRGT